jgi:predicted NAD-dependent protein-ADP-ribosyltransferase YbiA (DUF1768 family)
MKDKFVFYSKSPDKKPGDYKGSDWSEYVKDPKQYSDLEKINDWRKMFSNFYESPFRLDDRQWNSVEHFFHAVKFRDLTNDKNNPNYKFYETFSLNSKKPWSKDPVLSKMAGKAGRVSAVGKIYDKKIEGEKIPKDVVLRSDFYKGIDKKAMKLGFFAKFTQNEELKKALLSTKNAELYHLVTQRGKASKLELWDHLMIVRECIRKLDNVYDLSIISQFNSIIVSKVLNVNKDNVINKPIKIIPKDDNDDKINLPKNFVITITFGEVAENHAGMEQIGKMKELGGGLNLKDFKKAKEKFENMGFECIIYDLIKEGNVSDITPVPESAYVLLVKKGIKAFLPENMSITNINKEVLKREWDKKAFMKGRVVNKIARHNLNYADYEQEPDYENKKGRVVNFKDAPILENIRNELPDFFGNKTKKLYAEGNFYYDLDKCGIGFHGDGERRIVIAVRLGDKGIPFHYQWFQKSKPIGKRIIIDLEPGDLYAMSEIAVGTNWLKKNIPTLRHATGCKKFTEIKK